MPYKDKSKRKQYSIERPCNICTITKPRSEFNPYQHRCMICESAKLYRCWKCKKIKTEKEFAKESSKKLHISGMCKICKNKRSGQKNENYYIKRRGVDKKRKNNPSRKLRLFIKDCFKRLSLHKTSNAEVILGFTKDEFKTKFPIIPENYDIDHCIPLSWFKKDTPLNVSCSLSNLQLLPSLENAKKKNYYYHQPSDLQYFKDCIKYIDDKYLDLI